MAIQFGSVLQDALNGCIANAAPSGTTLNIYTGPVPATAESSLTGTTLLASIPCAANFGTESGGVLTFSNTGATNEVQAVGSGTPTFFRLVGPSTTTGSGGGGGGTSFSWSTTVAPQNDTTALPSASQGINATTAPYNADKTGAIDATTAIQSALNAAAQATANKQVLLPAGTYSHSGLITVPSGVTLYGVGTTSILKSTTGNARSIVVQGAGVLYNVQLTASGGTAFDSGNLNDCSVVMSGNGGRISTVSIGSAQSAGVVANGATSFTIDHVTVPNAASVYTDVIRVVNAASQGRIFGNHALAPNGDHICVKSKTSDSAACSNIQIWGNEIDSVNGGRGIAVYGGDSIVIHDNYLHGTYTGATAGIYIGNNTGFRPSTNIVIARNSSIALGGVEGMLLVAAQNASPLSSNIRIEDNYFTTSDDAIRIENAGVGSVVITGNTLVTPGHSINFANAPTGPIYVTDNVGDPANNGPYTEFWTSTTNPGPVVKTSGAVAQPFSLWAITADTKAVVIPLATLTGYSPGAADVISAYGAGNGTVYLSPDHSTITVWPSNVFQSSFKYLVKTSGGAVSSATCTLVYVWTGIDRPLGVPPGPGYHLTFNDDFDATSGPHWFDGTNASSGNWVPWYTWHNMTLNHEDELYIFPWWTGFGADLNTQLGGNLGGPININPFSVSNSVLSITASPIPSNLLPKMIGDGSRATPVGYQYKYFSGCMTTWNCWQQTYGYFEARMKLPQTPGQGLWPAYWMIQADLNWPPEFDIFEVLMQNPTQDVQTMHFTAGNQDPTVAVIADTSQFWHIYGFEWTSTSCKWYVDGVLTKTTTNDSHSPMILLLNLAVGGPGSWPGQPDANTVFPANFQVDWVRCWSSDPNIPVWTGIGTSGFPTTQVVREPWDQPFNTTSYWNLPIGSGAQWSAATDADTKALTQANGGINAGTFSNPYYIGVQSDPVKTVTCTDPLFPVGPQSIHVPAGAAPSPDSDSHMIFHDKTQPGKMWAYNGCTTNGDGSGWTCNLGQVDSVCGDGNDVTLGTAGYNFGAGTIRLWELQAGKIDHMIRYALSRDLAHHAGSWDVGVPWPGTHVDYDASSTYTGVIEAGVTIGIPASVNLSSLGLSAGGMVLAKCLQNHGAIWRDSGGTNAVIFYAEQAAEGNSVLAQMRTDMNKIMPQLRILRNQSASSVNGGGTPLVSGPPVLDGTICPTVTWPGGVTSGSITGGGGTSGDSMAGSGTGGIPASTGAGASTGSTSPSTQTTIPGGPILQGIIGQPGSNADLIVAVPTVAAGQQVYIQNWSINAPGT